MPWTASPLPLDSSRRLGALTSKISKCTKKKRLVILGIIYPAVSKALSCEADLGQGVKVQMIVRFRRRKVKLDQ